MERAMAQVTVLGGTGFLGRRIVQALVAHGRDVRVATRHPDGADAKRMLLQAVPAAGSVRLASADIRDAAAVSAAVQGADAVVNAVGLYVERGSATFAAIHVEGARRVALAVRDAAVPRLVHISGIGADPRSPSPYVRCRGRGEQAVREVFPDATILRPSAMFGETGGLIDNLRGLLASPVVPLFGRGRTLLQPVFVGDVAQAVVRTLDASWTAGRILELGGPTIYSYRELIERVMRSGDNRRLLVPVPFFVWDGLATLARLLPTPPLTEGQVALLKHDNVAGDDMPGLSALGIEPTALATML
jgi:NADH dehydrogenase